MLHCEMLHMRCSVDSTLSAVRSLQVCNTLCPAEGSPEKPVAIRVGTLDAELEPLVLSKASQHGLDPCWVTRLAKLDPQRRQV